VNEAEERALTRALEILVDDPVVPVRLAERVERRHRRRRIVSGGAAVLALVAVGIGGTTMLGGTTHRTAPPVGQVTVSPTPPTTSLASGSSTSQELLRRSLVDARFTATARFDGGGLTVRPATGGTPTVSEAEAVRRFRATEMPDFLAQDVLVGYGRVTLSRALRTGVAASLVDRPAWLVIYYDGPNFGCPDMTVGPQIADGSRTSTEGLGRRVFVLDALSGTREFLYRESGSRCGTPYGPDVSAAAQFQSTPWTEVRRDGATLTIRYSAPHCRELAPDQGMASVASVPQASASAPLVDEVTVFTVQDFPGTQCPDMVVTEEVQLRSSDAQVKHAPTGILPGWFTAIDPKRFDYDDGSRK